MRSDSPYYTHDTGRKTNGHAARNNGRPGREALKKLYQEMMSQYTAYPGSEESLNAYREYVRMLNRNGHSS